MSETKYFVRARGRITGPFDTGTLTRLVRRGMITAVDEISENRQSWERAGEFAELFPSKVPLAPPPQLPSEESGEPDAVETSVATESTPPAVDRYYYQQGAATVGPVPVGILKALAENGTLEDQDMVWAEGENTATRAGELPSLIPLFHADRGESLEQAVLTTRRSVPPGGAYSMHAQPARSSGQSYRGMAMTAMILAICGLFLFGFITGVLAIIFAGIALSGMGRTANEDGKGMAITGLVLGIIDVIGWFILIGATFG
jgi:hypothetical protein